MPEVLFVINDLETLDPLQTTAELIAGMKTQGAEAWVTSMETLGLTPRGVSVAARRWTKDVGTLRATPPTERLASSFDAVWIRTNPGRATLPRTGWLELMVQVADEGVPVRNHPRGLAGAASKLHLGSLPAGTTPRTWSSADADRLDAFLDELNGPAVLKPALGTRGAGVVRIQPDSPNRKQLLQEAVAGGPALLQDYLPAAPDGDVRIHLIDGTLLEVDGHPCAVRRVPGPGEWRSNVALGGSPAAATLTPEQRAVAELVAPVVAAQGLWHVGLDVVGDKVVECNVFSPGGFRDAGTFAGVDFVHEAVRRFLATLP